MAIESTSLINPFLSAGDPRTTTRPIETALVVPLPLESPLRLHDWTFAPSLLHPAVEGVARKKTSMKGIVIKIRLGDEQ